MRSGQVVKVKVLSVDMTRRRIGLSMRLDEPAAAERLTTFVETEPGGYICMVMDGQVVVRRMMNLSSSFDHRFVDGYDAAAMIQLLKDLLEQPATIFM